MFNVSEDVCRICAVHWNRDIFNLSTNFRNEGGGASSGILPHLGQIMQYQNTNTAEKYFVACMCWPLTLCWSVVQFCPERGLGLCLESAINFSPNFERGAINWNCVI